MTGNKLPKKSGKAGFTLLEMVISIGIFSVLVIAAIGITISVSNTQIKAGNIQGILDNIRFSLELLTKEMRTGNNYQLTTICAASGAEISFLNSASAKRIYFFDSSLKALMRATQDLTVADCSGATGKIMQFTAEDVEVQRFKVSLQGQAEGANDGQPWTLISLTVRSKSPKYELESFMDLQTMVTQRLRDIK